MVTNLLEATGLKSPHVADNYERGQPHYILGLDLGQASDYTALAVVERRMKNVGWPYVVTTRVNDPDLRGSQLVRQRRQDVENQYLVRHLGRPPLRTSYTDVVEGVIARIRALCPARLYPEGARVVLVVDATGVGRGVVDMLYSRLKDLDKSDPYVSLWACTITGGTGRSKVEDAWISLPKHELIFNGGVIPLQDGRLKWGPKIRERRVLEEELSNYRRKINIGTTSLQFEPWRESEHDDLLFALCLACWAWRKFELKFLRSYGPAAEIPPPDPEEYPAPAPPEPGGHTPLTNTLTPPDPAEEPAEDPDDYQPKPSGPGLRSA